MASFRGLWRLRLASRHAVLYGSIEGRIPALASYTPLVEKFNKRFSTNLLPTLLSGDARTACPAWFCQGARSSSSGTSGVVSFPLPQTGEGIKECELIQWFVKEGQSIIEFDKMCEVQSDKASVEITSPHSGTVLRLHAAEGDIVQVGATLLDIQLEGSADAAAAEVLPQPPPPLPEEAATEANPEPPSLKPAREDVPQLPAPGGEEGIAERPAEVEKDRILASPTVRRIARENKVDLADVKGTGAVGRVTRDDVEAYIKAARPPAEWIVHGPPEGKTVKGMGTWNVDADDFDTEEWREPWPETEEPEYPYELPLRGYRRAMVKSMTAAGQVPHFHFCDEVSMDELLRVRNLLRATVQGANVDLKLTFLPFIIKAISVALKPFPEVNSNIKDDGNSLIVHRQHNIGVAMATPLGLVVPNIKAVQKKSLIEIAMEIARLQEAAAENQLQPDDLAKGTITVSNIGTIGGTYASPLVNGKEVAIVAIGKLQEVARFVDSPAGRVAVPTKVMAMSWGADHRVLDGATLAKYSNVVKALLEQPERLLLHLS